MEIKTLEQYAVLRIEALEAESEKLQEQICFYRGRSERFEDKYNELKSVLNRISTHKYNSVYGEPAISFETITHKYDPEEYKSLASVIARNDSNDKEPETETSEA